MLILLVLLLSICVELSGIVHSENRSALGVYRLSGAGPKSEPSGRRRNRTSTPEGSHRFRGEPGPRPAHLPEGLTLLVRVVGLEPTHQRYRVLNPARLPNSAILACMISILSRDARKARQDY